MIYQNKMTIGALLAVIQISNLLANPITTLSYHITTLHAVTPIKKNVEKLMVEPKKTLQTEKISQLEKIQLKDVQLQYGDNIILNHISLDFEYGKKYLLVGKNGSGKSTLLKLINHQILNYQGKITADSIPMDRVSKEDYYRFETMIYQETYLFNDSIENNITLYQPYDPEKLEDVIRKFELQEIISKEKSMSVDSFSGGEKQRIALARAFLREPKFLLLDEAFSALDVNRRAEMERLLLQQDCAIINISHSYDKETINQYDKIIILENGSIVEVGKYSELSRQAKGYIHFDAVKTK